MEQYRGAYTGVGSRDTPREIQRMMVWLGFHLGRQGLHLRSGGAGGADTAFAHGTSKFIQMHHLDPREYQSIYLPAPAFKGCYHNPTLGIFDATQFPNWQEALTIAASIHPAWERCNPFARALHGRNTYQVLGHYLDYPSEFLVCWAPIQGNGEVKGGTRTAVELAKRWQVPVYNLALPEELVRLLEEQHV